MRNVVLGRAGGAQGVMKLVGECAPYQNGLSAILWNNYILSRFDQVSLYEQVDLRDGDFHRTTVGRRFGKFFALLRVHDILIQRVQGLDDIPFDEDAIKFRLVIGKSS